MCSNQIVLPWDQVRDFTNFKMKIDEGGFRIVYMKHFGEDDVVKIADYNKPQN